MTRILLISILICYTTFIALSQSEKSETALVLIDIQNFYFPGGKVELVEPEAAGAKAKEILSYFREHNAPVIHVKHKFTPGGEINDVVKPLENEKVIVKTEVNAFNGTELDSYLKSLAVKNVVVVGMQTHMCVEGATRGAYDLGYLVAVVGDACATRNLSFSDENIPADLVHASTLATLKSYAKVMTAEEFLKKFPF